MPRFLLFAALAALSASPALAQTCTTSWAAPVDGQWTNAANWTNGVPTSGSFACITEAGTYTVQIGSATISLSGFLFGGSSGTQTILSGLGNTNFTVTDEARIAPNARMEILNGSISNSDGLYVDGTLVVEGTLVAVNPSRFFSTGGLLDVAPGGTLDLRATNVGSGGATFRVRGLMDGRCGPGTCNMNARLDVQGGTIRASSGTLSIQGNGTINDLAVEVAEAAVLRFLRTGTGPHYVVEGTVSGTPVGELNWNGVNIAAGPSGATLDVGGTGFRTYAGSGQTVFFTSAGGTFTNTGLLNPIGNGLWIRDATLFNEGQVDLAARLFLEQNARVENGDSGEIAILGGSGIQGGPAGGRLTGGGRISAPSGGAFSITVPVDLDGAVVEVGADRLQLSGGALRDVEFVVAEGSTLSLTSANGEGVGGAFEVGGTLSGDPDGTFVFSSGSTLAAAPGGVTLAFGGTGLRAAPGSGQTMVFTSAGGEITNTGLVTVASNSPRLSEGIVRNQGTVHVLTTLQLLNGGTLINEAGGTVDFQNAGSTSSSDGTGRFLNEGLVVSSGSGRSSLAQLRGRAGSELRVLDGAEAQIFPPGTASIPAGAAITGRGQVSSFSQDLFIEGEISPGSDDAPIGTLTYGPWTRFTGATGLARLVIDVGADGASDLLSTFRSAGPGGSVQLAGTLLIRVADGYTPQVGDTFTVLRTTNATNDIVGDFDLVVVEGAPDGIGFVAERNENNTEVIVRAVEVEPGGPIRVSSTSVVGGGERRLFFSGPGTSGVTGARLECTSCLDPQAAGSLEAALSGDASLGLAVFDLTSPRAFGFYNLVLSRGALPDTTLPFTVRPFLSIALVRKNLLSGAGVRPDKGNPSYLGLLINGNSSFASYPFYVFDHPEPRVEWSVDSPRRLVNTPGRVFEDEEAGRDLTFFLTAITPERDVSVKLAQRLDPSDVLFPDQQPTGPDDDRVPFGKGFLVRYASSNHMSLERAASAFEAGLRSTSALTAFLADVDASDPSAVSRAVVGSLRSQFDYIASPSEGLALVLGELGGSQALIESAEAEFFDALDETGGTVIAEIAQASNDAVNAAPADVRQLFLDEVDALATAFPGSVTREDVLSGGSAAKQQGGRPITQQTGGPDTIPTGPFGGCLLNTRVANANTSLTADNERALLSSSGGSSGGGSGGGAGSGACGPYDPNDKTTSTPYLCEFGTVTVDGEEVPRCVRYYVPLANAQDVIPYQIAFENQASAGAPAEFVTITDVLDPSLDPSTLEVYSTSSDSTFTYTVSGQTITFRFTGIDLPPNVEPPEGEGFVSFGVRPRAGLPTGTEITNEAGIVFDFNPPIQTPPVIHELRETADLATVLDAPDFVEEGETFGFEVVAAHVVGDPVAEATLTISAGTPIASAVPTEGTCEGVGTAVVTCTLTDLEADELVTVAVELDDPPTGIYTLSSSLSFEGFDGYAANDTDTVESGVVGVGVEADDTGLPREVRLASIAPNPVRANATIRWGVPTATSADLRVYDLRGREVAVLAEAEPVAAGWHETVWQPDLASGVYLVRLQVGTEVHTKKLLVVR